jgi:hypothetical protein
MKYHEITANRTTVLSQAADDKAKDQAEGNGSCSHYVAKT